MLCQKLAREPVDTFALQRHHYRSNVSLTVFIRIFYVSKTTIHISNGNVLFPIRDRAIFTGMECVAVVCALASAPLSNNSLTIALWPPPDATWSVLPI